MLSIVFYYTDADAVCVICKIIILVYDVYVCPFYMRLRELYGSESRMYDSFYYKKNYQRSPQRTVNLFSKHNKQKKHTIFEYVAQHSKQQQAAQQGTREVQLHNSIEA